MLTLPPSANDPTYESAILAAVSAGQAEVSFAPVTNDWKGPSGASHHGVFYVTQDAVKLDGFRPGMGARLMQQVADILGCTFLTARLADLTYMQRAVTVTPITLSMMGLTTNEMMRISTMRQNSKLLDVAIAQANYSSGIVFGPGKPWIIDNKLALYPGKAENYGQYIPQPGGTNWKGVSVAKTVSEPTVGVLQGYWWPPFHELNQSDYSEMATLLSRYCVIDGQPYDTLDVMTNPELCGLMVHDEKPLLVARQPGVPIYGCTPIATKVGPMCPMPTRPISSDSSEMSVAQKVLLGIEGLAVAIGAFYFVRHQLWMRG